MEKVTLGTKVKRLGIQRLSCGEGAKCRAILLDPDPRMKHIAFDEVHKRRVEVDQDMVIKYGLRPLPTFYYLVAKLNTDLNGTVVGDKFTVEYLQMSENQNNEFAEAVSEQGIPKSLSITKVKKTANGRDFSYIKAIPSNIGIDDNPSLVKKIEELRANEEFINTCWTLIDADTSITKQQYLALLSGNTVEDNHQLPQPTPQPKQLPPQKEFEEANDFGDELPSSDDFNDF